jgi:V/A-type H+-transporting ATPase subunit C
MQTQYIYSASRVNTLSQYLLTKTDIDRLLVADAGDDLQSALKETYLAPYVLQDSEGDMAHAIEATLIEAKQLLRRIAPEGEMLEVLWVQYDLHNLRVFAKAQALGKTFTEVEQFVSARGIYDPSELYALTEKNELNRLQMSWQESYDAAARHATAGEIDQVDGVFDQLFFATTARIAQSCNDAFLRKYVRTIIDLYNLKARLRVETFDQIKFTPVFISGGSFAEREVETKEQVLAAFAQLGGDAFWRTAVEQFIAAGNTTHIDARADEYLVDMAKQASFDMFSSASLVLFYLQSRQSAANVRTIVVGKNSGMNEEDIRSNLRLAYVND